MTLTPTQVKGAIDTNIPDNTVGTVTPASMRDTLYTIVDNETGSGGSGGTVGGISSANFIDVTDLISSTTFPTIAEGGPSWVTSRGLTTVGDTPVWNVYFRQNTAPASPWPAVAQRQSVDGSYWVLQPQNGEIWVEQCGAQARPNNDKSFDNWPRFEDAKIVILMSRDQGKTVGTMRIGNGIFYLSKAHSIEGGGYHIRGLSMNNTSFIRCPYNSDGIQIQKSYGSAATFGHEGGAYLSFFDSNKGQEYYNDGIHVYVCTQAGRGSSTGPTGTGTGIVDGAAVFDYVRDLTWAEQRFSGAQEHYTISDLTIWSYWDHTNLSQNDDDVTVPGGGYHSGIVMRSKSTIRDVFTLGFSGHGVAIVADGDPELRGPGNTNGWRIYNLLSNYNQYDGLHIGYSDANAGNIIGLDTAYNGRWGYKDAGFLTNTAIDLQSAFDGNVTGGGQGKYMGTVTHKGTYGWPVKRLSASTRRLLIMPMSLGSIRFHGLGLVAAALRQPPTTPRNGMRLRAISQQVASARITSTITLRSSISTLRAALTRLSYAALRLFSVALPDHGMIEPAARYFLKMASGLARFPILLRIRGLMVSVLSRRQLAARASMVWPIRPSPASCGFRIIRARSIAGRE
jgi:hypothetical protein